MKAALIISRTESLQILRNDLRKLALEKHASALVNATSEDRAKIMASIDQEVKAELKRRAPRISLRDILQLPRASTLK